MAVVNLLLIFTHQNFPDLSSSKSSRLLVHKQLLDGGCDLGALVHEGKQRVEGKVEAENHVNVLQLLGFADSRFLICGRIVLKFEFGKRFARLLN